MAYTETTRFLEARTLTLRSAGTRLVGRLRDEATHLIALAKVDPGTILGDVRRASAEIRELTERTARNLARVAVRPTLEEKIGGLVESALERLHLTTTQKAAAMDARLEKLDAELVGAHRATAEARAQAKRLEATTETFRLRLAGDTKAIADRVGDLERRIGSFAADVRRVADRIREQDLRLEGAVRHAESASADGVSEVYERMRRRLDGLEVRLDDFMTTLAEDGPRFGASAPETQAAVLDAALEPLRGRLATLADEVQTTASVLANVEGHLVETTLAGVETMRAAETAEVGRRLADLEARLGGQMTRLAEQRDDPATALAEAETRLVDAALARVEALRTADAEEMVRRIAGVEARLGERIAAVSAGAEAAAATLPFEAETRLVEATLARIGTVQPSEADDVAPRIAALEAQIEALVGGGGSAAEAVSPSDAGAVGEPLARVDAQRAADADEVGRAITAVERRIDQLQSHLATLVEERDATTAPDATPAAATEGGAGGEGLAEEVVKTVLERLRAAGTESAPLRQRVLALEQRLDEVVFRLSR
jgi:hypothetical protein